jgi:hypothetical protein
MRQLYGSVQVEDFFLSDTERATNQSVDRTCTTRSAAIDPLLNSFLKRSFGEILLQRDEDALSSRVRSVRVILQTGETRQMKC